MKAKSIWISVLILAGLCLAAPSARGLQEGLPVRLEADPDEKTVEVHLGDRLFTAYRYGPEFDQKPVFYPVHSPGGLTVNRELPFIDPDTEETRDHPHHQSLYNGYGDVNGYDFWSHRGGEVIVHKAILEQEDNRLTLLLDWVTPEGETLLQEVRHVTFGGSRDLNWMDHEIRLQALDEPLDFNDTKEGMFALRLPDALREDEGTGRYENAFGWETSPAIWGKRSPWVAIRGEVEGEEVTVAIFDHPTTRNYPSYWHARGYGLFAVNPFGRKDFVKDAEPINDRLAPYESFHIRYRVLIYSGSVPKERLDQDYWDFIQ